MKKTPSRAIGRRRVLEAAALLGVAALTPARAANAQTSRKATPAAKTRVAAMSNDLSADEIRTLLQLEPNATCGFVRVTFVSKQSIAAGGLPAPFADGRPLGSALYFMVTPVAPVRLHRIRNDQLYHYYLGDPIEVFLLHADGRTRADHRRTGPARRPARAAADPRQHVPHRAAGRAPPLVPGREHRVAGRGAGRRGNRRPRRTRGKVSGSRRRPARDRRVGAAGRSRRRRSRLGATWCLRPRPRSRSKNPSRRVSTPRPR